MFNLTSMPSPSSVFAAYASTSASIVLVKTMFNQFVPPQFQQFVISKVRSYFKPRTPLISFLIEENSGMTTNLIYDAAELYLCTKVIPNAERLKISRSPKQSDFTIKFAQCEKIEDSFEGIELIWRFFHEEAQSAMNDINGVHGLRRPEKRFFELSFHKQFKDRVLDSYLPFVMESAKAIRAEKRVLKLHTLGRRTWDNSGVTWDSINLEHPSNFQTLAIDPDLKKEIIDDLDSFVEMKEFHKRVGKVWKRGYLLYGPPGTGKSSLIAAIANYLKFDVYDLQLTGLSCDSDLRRFLLATSNRSILVIEDIDCTVDLPDRKLPPGSKRDVLFTLSGLLNFIDGLWSSCGDERIIIFTTNNKEKLDPALLRPGRMDKHIHMSYCTNHGFKILASNYLGISRHWLFREIENLINQTKVTPAEIAEELMKNKEADVSLRGVVNLLKRKRTESLESKSTEGTEEVELEVEVNEGKRQKLVECDQDKVVANGVLLE